MIEIINIDKSKPYTLFTEQLNLALNKGQDNTDVISISSFDYSLNEVQSRCVNLKYIIENRWIFFTNYNSPKSKSFREHNQVAVLFFWPKINTQIRIKAKIQKTELKFNNEYFKKRELKKNALAIASEQSKKIESYEMVQKKYTKTLEGADLNKCPEYWGGFSFTPYYFEFWEGHESRINKRKAFDMTNGVWKHSFLQP